MKGERRYRYYVSRSLITGTVDSAARGWRLPAPEIERCVTAAICTLLNDQAAIAEAAHTVGLAESRLPSIFSTAGTWMKRLQSEVEVGAALKGLVDRVDLLDTGIRVALKLPNSIAEEQHGAKVPELNIKRVFPMQIRRRGFKMRLVPETAS
jgi:site-specific DNA recombinase